MYQQSYIVVMTVTVIKCVFCKRKLFPQDFPGCTWCVVISDSMCSYHCVCEKMYDSLIFSLNMKTEMILVCFAHSPGLEKQRAHSL